MNSKRITLVIISIILSVSKIDALLKKQENSGDMQNGSFRLRGSKEERIETEYWVSFGCGVNGHGGGSYSSYALGQCLKTNEGSMIYRYIETLKEESNFDGLGFAVERVRKSSFSTDDCSGSATVSIDVLPTSCSPAAISSGYLSFGMFTKSLPTHSIAGTIVKQFTSADCTGVAAMQSFDTPNSCKAGSTGVRYSCAHKDVVLNLFPSRECLGNADSFVLAQTGDCVKMGSAYFTFECVE